MSQERELLPGFLGDQHLTNAFLRPILVSLYGFLVLIIIESTTLTMGNPILIIPVLQELVPTRESTSFEENAFRKTLKGSIILNIINN